MLFLLLAVRACDSQEFRLDGYTIFSKNVTTHARVGEARTKYNPGMFVRLVSASSTVDALCFKTVEHSRAVCDRFQLLGGEAKHELDGRNFTMAVYAAEIVCAQDKQRQYVSEYVYQYDQDPHYYFKFPVPNNYYVHVFYIAIIVSIFVTAWFITLDHLNNRLKETEMTDFA